ncbi:MAG: repressor of yield of DENV family protein [Erysipelotrichaceae bacterium]|nr:repressor of yield of DENV family protein [Erysipelotrichaceae bacterium]MDY5251722.1 hypothetical protein [Erysipelotrichaceae bacterium]
MEKIKDNILRFLRGRYGNDQFNNFIVLFSLVFAFLNIFIENPILTIVAYASMIYAVYRMFSKDIWSRQRENITYLDNTRFIRMRFNLIKRNLTDKQYKYFICPKCKQMVRVPRNKGKIEINCPKCHHKFDRKS